MPPQCQHKRKRILAAAQEVCSRVGYDGARMDDIAHQAGVSKGTLYNFFAGKEALLVATVLSTYRDFVVLLPQVDDPRLGPRARLEALTESLARGFEAIAEHILLTHHAWSIVLSSPPDREELLRSLREIYAGHSMHLQSILQSGIDDGSFRSDIDVEVFATNWMAIYDGLLYRAGFQQDETNPAYSAEGVRKSLGWLTEQLRLPEDRKALNKSNQENTAR